MTDLRTEIIDWTRTIASAVALYLGFTTVAFAQYEIPSESMVPHLEVGDRVLVSKFAYGYSRFALPFDLGALLPAGERRLFGRLPARGDVAVFVHPVTGETMIKRVIGLPGDTVEMREGALYINGEEATTSAAALLLRRVHPRGREWAERYEETLPGGATHAAHNLSDHSRFDNYGPYSVPEGYLFMMGDNRDNSLDSRWEGMGPAPIENLIGRAELVHYAAPCRSHDTACPMPRWLRPLHR